MVEECGEEFFATVILWVAALVVLLARGWSGRQPVVGLALAYWVNLAIIHLLGGLIQILPWHHSRDRLFSIYGFTVTGYAMAGFIAGQFIPRPKPRNARPMPAMELGENLWLAGTVIWSGLLFYFAISGMMSIVPSFGAILSNGLNVGVAGFCLLFWFYYKAGLRHSALFVLGSSAVLPALTLILRGFLGYGISAMLAVACFFAIKYVPRRTVVIGGLLLGFVGLSFYATYMSVRTEIRAAVWGEENLADRVMATAALERDWTWADLGSSTQLSAIENRLNQNALVGAAWNNIEARRTSLAWGETIAYAFRALVPRIIWPDKPFYAGSGTLVTRFTGIHFARGTSVGIGHVMELYINFGTWGVLIGFILIGYVVTLIDERAGLYLQFGNTERFLLWFVAGQTLMTVGGNFAESFPAIVGSIILCLVLSRSVLAGWTQRAVSEDFETALHS